MPLLENNELIDGIFSFYLLHYTKREVHKCY